jgi:ubiquinone/menaquinone biosynthesis C-methylase UbiE
MKRVDPKVYTKEYYLNDCTGFAEFKKSFGKILEPRFIELIKYFKIEPNTKVLDIGCGRGEMVFFAALNGADAVGIDYSKDAIDLANLANKKQSKTIRAKTEFLLMDAKKLAFPDSSFNTVVMTDVVEHLYPQELDLAFKEIKRVLKNQGLVVIHTAPNKIFNDYFYKFYSYPMSSLLVSIWRLISGKKYPNIAKPSDLRTDSHAIMHINEPTYYSLRQHFRKYGFTGKIISTNITAIKPMLSFKDLLFNSVVFLHPLSKRFPFNVVSGSDFVSILTNNK